MVNWTASLLFDHWHSDLYRFEQGERGADGQASCYAVCFDSSLMHMQKTIYTLITCRKEIENGTVERDQIAENRNRLTATTIAQRETENLGPVGKTRHERKCREK